MAFKVLKEILKAVFCEKIDIREHVNPGIFQGVWTLWIFGVEWTGWIYLTSTSYRKNDIMINRLK